MNNSVLKMILYGPRIRINQSYPGNIGSYDPYFSPILEILDRTIHIQSYPGNIGSYDPYISPMGGRGGSAGAPRRDGVGVGDGGVPTTLPSGQTPRPSRPGTKYPVRGQSLISIYTKLDTWQLIC